VRARGGEETLTFFFSDNPFWHANRLKGFSLLLLGAEYIFLIALYTRVFLLGHMRVRHEIPDYPI
jgi:hypothetical protein